MGPQEKPAALGSHLFLHRLVAALCGGGRAAEGGWGAKALTGGLPPTVPLWSLRLALSYHDSALALAASELSRAALKSGELFICQGDALNPPWRKVMAVLQ